MDIRNIVRISAVCWLLCYTIEDNGYRNVRSADLPPISDTLSLGRFEYQASLTYADSKPPLSPRDPRPPTDAGEDSSGASCLRVGYVSMLGRPELPSHAGGLAFQPMWAGKMGGTPNGSPCHFTTPDDPPYAPQNYPRLSANKSMRGFQSRPDGSRQLPYTRLVNGCGMSVNPVVDTGRVCPPCWCVVSE